ncbi:MAG TPA: copper resistance protein CopC [Gemmatimonadaceae bacterium]|nr:copper resistance protein CopC [Gemmatimonadaceae bacterium]
MRSAATAILAASILTLAVFRIAHAHAMLLASEPEANSHVNTSPERVRLVFSEAIEPTLARVAIIDGSGAETPLAASSDPRDVRAIIAATTPLAAGAYRVVWRVVSADGHPVAGSFTFTVGAAASKAPPVVAGDTLPGAAAWGPSIAGAPVVPAVLRGAALGTLMAFTGLLFFLVTERMGGRDVDRTVGWLGAASVVLIVAHAVAWSVNASPEHGLSGASLATALDTRMGRMEAWRSGLAMLSLWAMWLARRRALALFFAAAALAVSGASGHAGALHPSWSIPAKAIHLLAVAAWLGGLCWLVGLFKRRPGRAASDGAAEGALFASARRVSAIALAAAIAVALTGVAQSIAFVPSPRDLWHSAYGIVILLKTAGFAALVAFGAYHRYRVVPGIGTNADVGHRFRRTLRLEILTMSLVVLLGGLLAYVPTPAVRTTAPASEASQ